MNTIKTKIGFETKPYSIQNLQFVGLFNVSTRSYGTVCLFLATLLSATSLFTIKEMRHSNAYQLTSLKQEASELEQHYNLLTKEYEQLSSSHHLKSNVSQTNMHLPFHHNSISLPRNNVA